MRSTKEGGAGDWMLWFGLLLGIWAVGWPWPAVVIAAICRNCHEETGDEVLVDLGMQPLANSWSLATGGRQGLIERIRSTPWRPSSARTATVASSSSPSCRTASASAPTTRTAAGRARRGRNTWPSLSCHGAAGIGPCCRGRWQRRYTRPLLDAADPAIGYLNIDPSAPANGQRPVASWTWPWVLGPIAD